MAQVKQWTRFGWQGLLFETPSGWDLTRFHGSRKKGYARLSDPDTPRMEVRWEMPRRGVPFRAIADRAVRQLSKSRGVEIERHTGMIELDARDTETFTCRAEGAGALCSYNLLSACRECGRMVMARIVFRPGENIKAVARRVFSSVRDHSYDGADVWAAYGIEFAVPETVELDEALIYPGSLDFRFKAGADWIEVGRIALGSMILERQKMADWFRAFARRRFKRIRFDTREADVRSHRGLEATGRLRGFGGLIPRLMRRQRFVCRLWHCDVSDKLCFYAVLAGARKLDFLAPYSERIVCH